MVNKEYVEILEGRLAWAISAERYELAAGLRDQIRYYTTEPEEDIEWKNEYMGKMMKKYSPDIYETLKHHYENK